MMRLIEPASNSAKGPLLSLLVPLLDPHAGAQALRVLARDGALFAAARLLLAEQPLVVQVPAVQRLVLRGEALVAGRRADGLDLIEAGHLLRRQFGEFRRENLKKKQSTTIINKTSDYG